MQKPLNKEEERAALQGLSERLRALLQALHLNINEFSRETGFSSGALSKIMQGHRSFGIDKVFHIITVYPQLNLEWLLRGHGPMFHPTEVPEPYAEIARLQQEAAEQATALACADAKTEALGNMLQQFNMAGRRTASAIP